VAPGRATIFRRTCLSGAHPMYFMKMVFELFAYAILGFLFIPLRQIFVNATDLSLIQSLVLPIMGTIVIFAWSINCVILLFGKRSILIVNRFITFYKELLTSKFYPFFLHLTHFIVWLDRQKLLIRNFVFSGRLRRMH
jgi:hypothetical protein